MNLTILHYCAAGAFVLAATFGALSHAVPAQAALFASLAGVCGALSTALAGLAPAAAQSPEKQLAAAKARVEAQS